MAELEKKPVKIVETILRDAHPVSYTHLKRDHRQSLRYSLRGNEQQIYRCRPCICMG